jgi:UV DNA damage repair endonuclease
MDCVVRILGWNHTNSIGYFRLSDSMIPKLYKSDAVQLCSRLKPELRELRGIIDEWNMRVTFHFTNFAFTAAPSTWLNTVAALTRYATVLESLGDNAWMECHLGTRKPGVDWLNTIIRNIDMLPDWVRRKITFENDVQWSPADTLAACLAVDVPFTYDIEHHRLFARTRVSEPPTKFTTADIEGFVSQCYKTWSVRDAWATVHVSSPVDRDATEDRHADYVTYEDYARLRRAIHRVGGEYYIVIEAKQLDNAVLQLQRIVSGRRPAWSRRGSYGVFV